MSSAGIAPQLTGTSGPFARVERRWIAEATSSLPVPLSPSIRTGESDSATRSTSSFTRAICGEVPTSSLTASASPSRVRSVRTSWLRKRFSRSRVIRWCSSSRFRGLIR